MEYAIGIDLGGTSIKYALVDKAGNSFFEGKLPSFASVSAAKVIEQLIKAVMLLKDEVNPEKPDVPLNKNDAFQKVQKRRVQEKR